MIGASTSTFTAVPSSTVAANPAGPWPSARRRAPDVGAEVVLGRRDLLTPGDPIRHRRARFPQPGRANLDRLVVVGDEDVVRVDLDHPVGPRKLPVDAARRDRATQAVTAREGPPVEDDDPAPSERKMTQVDHGLHRDIDREQMAKLHWPAP
jgi:hypothetical protein